MLIAKTQQESDAFIEQEQSHVCVFENKARFYEEDNTIYALAEGRLFEMPKRERRMKTKKYGTLAMFDTIQELITSKYNKGIIVGYCAKVSVKKTKRVNVVCCDISTPTEFFTIEDKEFSSKGGIYINNIEGVEPQGAYLFVMERNKFCNLMVQVIDNYKLKTKN